MKLSFIASYLELEFIGEDVEISSMNELDVAISKELSFCVRKKYKEQLQNSKAIAFLITRDLESFVPKNTSYIICDDVSLAMAKTTKLFAPKPIDFDANETKVGEGSFVDKRANVEKGAIIGKNTVIMAGVYVGSNVKIGDNTILYPNVVVYRDCVIGNNCIIHSGTVIGSDGFGFAHTKEGKHIKIYQNGNVVIEDDVEIGSNCSIDRAVFGSTIIKQNSKLDNFLHVAHNCEIGKSCIFVAQSGIGGSTKIGDGCVVSGQSAFSDHLSIAPYSTFSARSGVTKDIKESGKVWRGYPLMPHREWRRLQAKIMKL